MQLAKYIIAALTVLISVYMITQTWALVEQIDANTILNMCESH